MKKLFCEVVFIYIVFFDERVEFLKFMNEIEKMEDDCEEIYIGGFLKRYIERFYIFENVILVDWVVWYDVC